MGNGYEERAKVHERGLVSVHFETIQNFGPTLTDEQVAIMACVWENVPADVAQVKLEIYVRSVSCAQMLMPAGTIRSQQILSTLCLIAIS